MYCGDDLTGHNSSRENNLCSDACRTALEKTGGYIGPRIDGIQRCPVCRMRVASGIPASDHCRPPGNRLKDNWHMIVPGKG